MPETGPEDLPALGFLSLSPSYWKELKLPCEIIKVIVADEWEERVDAVSRTFLGLTVACARCHDHKFDPISSEDYYALAGIFASCRQVERPLISDRTVRTGAAGERRSRQTGSRDREAEKGETAANGKARRTLSKDQEKRKRRLRCTTRRWRTRWLRNRCSWCGPERRRKTALGWSTAQARVIFRRLFVAIRIVPAPMVPRRFLTVLTDNPQPYQNGSGRLELAESITTDAASLAARVIVNRVWLAHFGQGIVATPSNFGRQGSQPTHPQLLDDLAARFIAGGWSIKRLHREILLSATWQQSSADDQHRARADPDNRLVVSHEPPPTHVRAVARRDVSRQRQSWMRRWPGLHREVDAVENNRRTLYATVHRRDMSPTLMVHDFPDPTQHSAQRTSTVTALQGLYALNGPLLVQQSQELADRLRKEASDDHRGRITRAYWLLFSRQPTQREVELGLAFVGNAKKEESLGDGSNMLTCCWPRMNSFLLTKKSPSLFPD